MQHVFAAMLDKPVGWLPLPFFLAAVRLHPPSRAREHMADLDQILYGIAAICTAFMRVDDRAWRGSPVHLKPKAKNGDGVINRTVKALD